MINTAKNIGKARLHVLLSAKKAAATVSNWILSTGFWNDSKVWVDTENWID